MTRSIRSNKVWQNWCVYCFRDFVIYLDQKHGYVVNFISEFGISIQDTQNDYDPSYSDFCIPSSLPDLDCKDILQKRFTFLPPDPPRFDEDEDGVGMKVRYLWVLH